MGNRKLKICISLWTKLKLFCELGELMADAIATLGHEVAVCSNDDPESLNSDVLILLGDGTHFELFRRLLTENPRQRPHVILWQVDSLPPNIITDKSVTAGIRNARLSNILENKSGFERFILEAFLKLSIWKELKTGYLRNYSSTGNFFYLMTFKTVDWYCTYYCKGWLDNIVVSTRAKFDFMERLNIPATLVPFGYHPKMGGKLEIERDIDVVFYGAIISGKSPRRIGIFENIKKELSDKNIQLHLVKNCFGASRTEILNRAKISLSISNHPWDVQGIRFLRAMGCGSMVISEKSPDTHPYIAGKHLVQADISDLSNVIEYYIRHKDERDKIAHAAYEFVTTELTLEGAVSKILNKATAVRPVASVT